MTSPVARRASIHAHRSVAKKGETRRPSGFQMLIRVDDNASWRIGPGRMIITVRKEMSRLANIGAERDTPGRLRLRTTDSRHRVFKLVNAVHTVSTLNAANAILESVKRQINSERKNIQVSTLNAANAMLMPVKRQIESERKNVHVSVPSWLINKPSVSTLNAANAMLKSVKRQIDTERKNVQVSVPSWLATNPDRQIDSERKNVQVSVPSWLINEPIDTASYFMGTDAYDEIDAGWEVVTLSEDGSFKLSQIRRRNLLRQHRLQHRDFRRIDPSTREFPAALYWGSKVSGGLAVTVFGFFNAGVSKLAEETSPTIVHLSTREFPAALQWGSEVSGSLAVTVFGFFNAGVSKLAEETSPTIVHLSTREFPAALQWGSEIGLISAIIFLGGGFWYARRELRRINEQEAADVKDLEAPKVDASKVEAQGEVEAPKFEASDLSAIRPPPSSISLTKPLIAATSQSFLSSTDSLCKDRCHASSSPSSSSFTTSSSVDVASSVPPVSPKAEQQSAASPTDIEAGTPATEIESATQPSMSFWGWFTRRA
eukprot:gene28085-31193_t